MRNRQPVGTATGNPDDKEGEITSMVRENTATSRLTPGAHAVN